MTRALAPHGTYAAFQRHMYHAEDPCQPCRDASSEYQRARRGSDGQHRRVAECGTESGYNRHRRNGETVCDPCQEAVRVSRRNTWRRRQVRKHILAATEATS